MDFLVTMWPVLISSGQGSVVSYYECNNEHFGSIEGGNLVTDRETMSFSGRILFHGFTYAYPKQIQRLTIYLPTPSLVDLTYFVTFFRMNMTITNTFNYEFGQSQFLKSSNDKYGHKKFLC